MFMWIVLSILKIFHAVWSKIFIIFSALESKARQTNLQERDTLSAGCRKTLI